MTDAGWTREVPKEIGVYWWRSNAADNHPWIVRVHKGWLGLMLMQAMGGPLVTIGDGGEWLGPITPTDRQQGRVAAFKEASRKLDNLRDRYMTSNETDLNDFERWLAQAAQDEKGVGDVLK